MSKKGLAKRMAPMINRLGPVLAGAYAIVRAAQENPQIKEQVLEAADQVKAKWQSRNPRHRLARKLAAVNQCADLIETNFSNHEALIFGWRMKIRTLETRADLAWQGHHGRKRKSLMKPLLNQADELLDEVNETLEQLSNDVALADPNQPSTR